MDGIGQLFGSNVKQKIPMSYVGVPAILSVVNTDNHGPIIEIRSLDMNNPSNSSIVNDYLTSGKPWWEDTSLRNKPRSMNEYYVLHHVVDTLKLEPVPYIRSLLNREKIDTYLHPLSLHQTMTKHIPFVFV
mmetsp:Transcript_13335/g.24150  ORF Transcript_13335/g.24150 Transcript_13335/m.24150 type:complete len:131 (-) Transcript_13335:20-412(-)